MMITLKQHLDTPDGLIASVKTAVYAVFVYLEIDMNVTGILFALMMLDTLLGVIKVFTLGQKFTFKKLMWGIVTKISVLSIPLTVALMAKGVDLDLRQFVLVVMDVLIVSEGFSAITNMLSIKTKKDIQNADYITVLLSKIRDLFRVIIETLIGDIKKD